MSRIYLTVFIAALLVATVACYSANKTLYQNIKECEETSIFAKFLDYPHHAELKAVLNDENSPTMTIFVPNNAAVKTAQKHLDKLLKRSGYPSTSELLKPMVVEHGIAAMGFITAMQEEDAIDSMDESALEEIQDENSHADLELSTYELVQARYKSRMLRRRAKELYIPPGLNMTDILLRYFKIGMKYYVVPVFLPTKHISSNLFVPTLAKGDSDFVALGTDTQRMHLSNLLITHPDLYTLLPKGSIKENQLRMTPIAIGRGVSYIPISKSVARSILSNSTQLKPRWRRFRRMPRSDLRMSKMFSSVVLPDAVSSNGIFHIINRVLPLPLNVTTLLAPANLTLMELLLNKTGLGDYFNSLESVTLFAPSDDAFITMFKSLSKEQLMRTTMQDVKDLLMHHMAYGTKYPGPPDSLQLPKSFQTLFGSPLKFTVTNITNGYFVNDARIIKAGILLRNGVMYVIDKVLSL